VYLLVVGSLVSRDSRLNNLARVVQRLNLEVEKIPPIFVSTQRARFSYTARCNERLHFLGPAGMPLLLRLPPIDDTSD
jgi:hypothetical protein